MGRDHFLEQIRGERTIRNVGWSLLFLFFAQGLGQVQAQINTPTRTTTFTSTATFTKTSTPTPTGGFPVTMIRTGTSTSTPTFTSTASSSPTLAGTVTGTATLTRTFTLTATATRTGSPAPTFTLTNTPTQLPTMVPITPTPSVTLTLTGTATMDPTPLFQTLTWTPTFSPILSFTPTPTFTPGSGAPPFHNPVTLVSGVIGCTDQVVVDTRALDLDTGTSYLVMRITALCGACTVADIMNLRLTRGWDQVCANYGIDWATFAADLQARENTLIPEFETANQILRAAANDPNAFPIEIPVAMPDNTSPGAKVSEGCGSCP